MNELTLDIVTELGLIYGDDPSVSGKAFWAEVDRLATFGEDWIEQEILL